MSKRPKGPLPYSAPGIGAAWLGHVAIFGFGDGHLKLGETIVKVHAGAMLTMQASPDRPTIWTSGDDGRLVETDASGHMHEHLTLPRKWLDSIALDPTGDGAAVAAGQTVYIIRRSGKQVDVRPPRGPTALAFTRDGQELAVAHGGGVSLYEAETGTKVQDIPCAGGPVSICYGQEDSFLFVGLSEPALAGWRLADGQAFKMGGYPAKPRQLCLNDTGTVLLTSGGPALLAWPLLPGKGPMGQSAGVYRSRLGLATSVAALNGRTLVGWSDGGIDEVDLATGQFKHVHGPRPRQQLLEDPRKMRRSIIDMALHPSSARFCFVGEDGTFGHGWLN